MEEDFANFLEDFMDMLNGLEASVVKMKQQIAKLVGVAEEKHDMGKIKWEAAEGSSGAYERSADVNNPDFKALLKDVQAHGGKMTVGGYFVWAFKNGATLGRKQRKR
jgi:DNA-binding phage protein